MPEQLGKFNCTNARLHTHPVTGRMEFTVEPDPEFRLQVQKVIQGAKHLEDKGKGKLVLTVQEYKNTRSIQQNNMMWALLEVMASYDNGGRTGGTTAMDCYLDMLEKYGGKFEYLECTQEAMPRLREMFRQLKVVEERKDGKTVMCKAYVGSSKYDTKEMSDLIEGILDELAKRGIENSEVSYWREEWDKSQPKTNKKAQAQQGAG